MPIGKYPSWGIIEPDGTEKHFFRHPERDMVELDELEHSHKEEDQREAKVRRHLLGYKKYEKEIKKYLGKRDYCKECRRNRFYDIDWYDGVIDCRDCGYHVESIRMLIRLMVDEGEIPKEPESEPISRRAGGIGF
jgi:hypothetical protein